MIILLLFLMIAVLGSGRAIAQALLQAVRSLEMWEGDRLLK
ncbi:MAG: hypothetical protein ACKOQS_23890 [Dolichospermum sp.]